jgi:ABC-type uncharacterized transport system substrate-binding protein
MQRREFITILGGAAAAWPLAASAQVAGRVWRIGILTLQTPTTFSGSYGAFLQGMRDLGYLEGKDFVSETRFAGDYARLPALAAELVQSRVDILVTGSTAGVRALQQATTTIPIVFASVTDPVRNGFVDSLARPGGNTTGLANSVQDTASKQLELLASALPNPSRIGLLINPENPSHVFVRETVEDAAQTAKLLISLVEARNRQEIDDAFAALGRERVQVVMVAGDAIFFVQRQQLAELALKYRLPSMFAQREYAEVGGMMSYGESLSDFYRRAATFVHKIMRGAKPQDLPVEQPTRFHLVINRKTADTLGVTIPALLYIFTDEVIE